MRRFAVIASALLMTLSACAPQVSSEGQTGGVTAGTVSTFNQFNFAPERKQRHLTDADKKNLVRVFRPLASHFPIVDIKAPGDGEAQGYAAELMDAFNGIGIKVARVGFIIPRSANAYGMAVVVRDLNYAPPAAEEFAEAMVSAGFQVQGGNDAGLADDKFYLCIGSLPQ
jgi:hypothetical protein